MHDMTSVHMVCHDQEPLDFDYMKAELSKHLRAWLHNDHPIFQTLCKYPQVMDHYISRNIGFTTNLITIYDRNIITHSELRSPQIERYSNVGLEGVYWWSHALMARDWYRYAEVDPKIQSLPDHYTYDFNIYNRAWTGTREYRIKFTDLLIENNLISNCQVAFNTQEDNQHYLAHRFNNIAFASKNNLSQLPKNHSDSSASADYSSDDYLTCWFDVVLETLYDDPRLHLTEKILRPIACGKPFLLCATPGSLEYLRSYGFKTFAPFVNEDYDQLQDPLARMQAIIQTMKSIALLTEEDKATLNQKLKEITNYNKELFFSDKFFKHVIGEFVTNYQHAREICNQHQQGNNWIKLRKQWSQIPELKQLFLNFDSTYYSKQNFMQLMLQLRQTRTRMPVQLDSGSLSL